ncbi:hypothetical protein [Bradyrhizobium sp. 145]|uniref:hypothetical protein n=1 Tax=Bradyrhizobium sp. 145 TaxID=2782621 RepID=UPI001FFBA996|nr:hypothetical protein [Bradyrhizobium sp. 145]MCK1689251.1 hypothetical protein [Bradyrhizobium sp. 145]
MIRESYKSRQNQQSAKVVLVSAIVFSLKGFFNVPGGELQSGDNHVSAAEKAGKITWAHRDVNGSFTTFRDQSNRFQSQAPVSADMQSLAADFSGIGRRCPATPRAVRASPLPPIMIAGNSDHDRLETMITMLWNG